MSLSIKCSDLSGNNIGNLTDFQKPQYSIEETEKGTILTLSNPNSTGIIQWGYQETDCTSETYEAPITFETHCVICARIYNSTTNKTSDAITIPIHNSKNINWSGFTQDNVDLVNKQITVKQAADSTVITPKRITQLEHGFSISPVNADNESITIPSFSNPTVIAMLYKPDEDKTVMNYSITITTTNSTPSNIALGIGNWYNNNYGIFFGKTSSAVVANYSLTKDAIKSIKGVYLMAGVPWKNDNSLRLFIDGISSNDINAGMNWGDTFTETATISNDTEYTHDTGIIVNYIYNRYLSEEEIIHIFTYIKYITGLKQTNFK